MPAGARQLRPDSGRRNVAGAAVADSPAVQAGKPIGGTGDSWLIERRISRSSVWCATGSNGQTVAIKTGPRRSIESEYRILSRLRHPGIVTVFDRVEVIRGIDGTDGLAGPGIVLEYLPGGDLVSLAGAAAEHWLRPAAELIDALAYLHRNGYVHRDIKARNVLIGADGSARLIDFGSALAAGSSFTRGGTTVVAPARGAGPVTVADDIFSLAALLFELLFGHTPGWGGTGRGALDPVSPNAGRAMAQPGRGVSCSELLAVICRGLAGGAEPEKPGLDDFGAVIESMLDQSGIHR